MKNEPGRGVIFTTQTTGLRYGACLISAALGLWTTQAQLVVNGGFDTGDFTGWDVLGIANLTDSSIGVSPVSPQWHALLTTESGIAAEGLESFVFGSSSGQLSLLDNGIAFQGAAIKQSITVSAGQSLQISWDFLTTEDPDAPPFANDFAFVSLVPSSTFTLAAVSDETPMMAAPVSTGFDFHTGYKTFRFDFTQGGVYNLSIGVVNVTDGNGPSGLLVDSISVVPEPTTWAMATSLALMLVGTVRRLRRKP